MALAGGRAASRAARRRAHLLRDPDARLVHAQPLVGRVGGRARELRPQRAPPSNAWTPPPRGGVCQDATPRAAF
eukprot:1948747-Prymnesium_polylepis.1